jgi:hypothetical protein
VQLATQPLSKVKSDFNSENSQINSDTRSLCMSTTTINMNNVTMSSIIKSARKSFKNSLDYIKKSFLLKDKKSKILFNEGLSGTLG